ncbi:MAG TPA: NAD(P)/FAD-dependent oxidoreductase [Polyangiaceae bacterium]|nr:NAD(P)/FAD-dependent oxidoreductase [Polyangiaceae bacterium]
MPDVAVIGAGPAGLTAAHVLTKGGARVTVLEADPTTVGGISRTVVHRGFRFDIGGHRFFSKSREIEDFWSEILPHDMLERPRSSRIYYEGKFFSYPLRPLEALSKLGPVEAGLCVASYAKARLSPVPNPKNFEDWVTNQFGERLFRIFFKTYTEKVWGMSCREISSDWAAQRIKGLSLSSAVLSALAARRAPSDRSGVIKTLIDTFRYPRLGPGMMWEACAEGIRARGGSILLGRRVSRVEYDAGARKYTVEHAAPGASPERLEVDRVICSAPLSELCRALAPAVSSESLEAASSLKYRDFLIVVLMAKDTGAFADNWLYIQDPSVQVGRIQNFKSWSPEMVPDPTLAAYGCEYFCHAGDGLWTSTDAELTALAKREMAAIGLLQETSVIDSAVVRQPKAYPVYDSSYQRHVDTIRSELRARFPGLYVVGRNGMHKYNNQDHSMMTAMLAAKNVLAGHDVFDPWLVNQDAEYHEEGAAGAEESGRLIPRLLRRSTRPPPP